MKKFLLWLWALLLIPACALAVITVPDGVTEIGAEAFSGTAADALIVPSSVQTVGADVLANCDASYIYLKGASTALESGANNGVPFVFGPSGSPAASLSGFYPLENLSAVDGLYYAVDETALPLCAKSPRATAGTVTIPKYVNGKPVTSLAELYIANTGITELKVPRYLSIPDGLDATPYQTMTAIAPTPNVTEIPAGKYVTWTTERPESAWGDVTYTWRFVTSATSETLTTTEPTVKHAPMAEGTCKVTVTVQDALGDYAYITSQSITVTEAQPVYRALLVGNNYPGAFNNLKGPENDLVAMNAMLSTMSGTPYRITKASNLTASGMQAAIATAFAGAEPGDFSLFYYSGHGTEAGALVGTSNTFLTVYALRTALDKIPGTKIVLLDCCYSGNAINKSTGETTEPNIKAFNRAIISGLTSQSRSSEDLAANRYIVLTASRKDQQSISLTGGDNYYWGVFTYGLCYGSGYDEWNREPLGYLPADSDANGAITLGEAYRGVQERVTYLNGITYVEQAVQYHGDTTFLLWRK